jgi:hypothetical protein
MLPESRANLGILDSPIKVVHFFVHCLLIVRKARATSSPKTKMSHRMHVCNYMDIYMVKPNFIKGHTIH